MLNRYPGAASTKGTVRMTRADECQGIHDRLTEIALEFADAGEQTLFLWNPYALCCGEGGRAGGVYVRAFLEIFPRKIGHSTMAGRIVKKWMPLSKIWKLCYASFSTGYPLKG